jgi:hypothetical protein
MQPTITHDFDSFAAHILQDKAIMERGSSLKYGKARARRRGGCADFRKGG